jgi:hypothetical protein
LNKENPSPKQRNIATNAYRLLSTWKIVPGTQAGGELSIFPVGSSICANANKAVQANSRLIFFFLNKSMENPSIAALGRLVLSYSLLLASKTHGQLAVV